MTTDTTTDTNWKNVNNWHWIEKDCTSWAHERLKVLLPSTAKTGTATVSKVTSVTGEVSVNVRKGRIRQIFDLTISLKVKLLAAQEEELDATIIDYMSDTDFAGFEFKCSGREKQLSDLKKAIWEALEAFKREVEETHGKSLLVNMTRETAEKVQDRPKFHGVTSEENKEIIDKSETSTIEDTVIINAPFAEVWACLTDPVRIAAWTRGTSKVNSFEPGASFSLLNGNILGTISSMSSDMIKMDWRLKHWDGSRVSTVELALKSTMVGETSVKLKQRGVPAAEVDSVKENWYRYYWEPIKTLLGCSSVVF